MDFVNHRTIYSVLFYILSISLLFISKPKFMFINSSIKQFGIGYKKTLFSFGVFTVTLALVSFYAFAIIDVIF